MGALFPTDHIAVGLLLMAILFVPIAAAVAVAIRVVETLGVAQLRGSRWIVSSGAALWIAWWGQALYWLGRERAQHERNARLDPHVDWWAGWNVLEWSPDAQIDLFLPVAVNAALAAVISALLARHGQRLAGAGDAAGSDGREVARGEAGRVLQRGE